MRQSSLRQSVACAQIFRAQINLRQRSLRQIETCAKIVLRPSVTRAKIVLRQSGTCAKTRCSHFLRAFISHADSIRRPQKCYDCVRSTVPLLNEEAQKYCLLYQLLQT